MKNKATLLLGRYFPSILLLLLFSCDPFQEDSIQTPIPPITPSAKNYYILPNSSTIIDLKSLVTTSFISATLSVSEYPTQGALTLLTDLKLKYEPILNFIGGVDQFKVAFNSNGNVVKTETLSMHMVQDTTLFPCGLYAIGDVASTKPETGVSILYLNNDRFCNVVMDSIQAAIFVVPEHGNAILKGDTILYTPFAGYQGSDQLIYKLSTVGDSMVTSFGVINLRVDYCDFEDVFFDLTSSLYDQELDPCTYPYEKSGIPEWNKKIECLIAYGCEIEVSFLTPPVYGEISLCSANKISYAPRLMDLEDVKDDTFKINVRYKFPPEVITFNKVVTFYIKRTPDDGDCLLKLHNTTLDLTDAIEDPIAGSCDVCDCPEGYWIDVFGEEFNQPVYCGNMHGVSWGVDRLVKYTSHSGSFCEGQAGALSYKVNPLVPPMNDTLAIKRGFWPEGLNVTQYYFVKRQ